MSRAATLLKTLGLKNYASQVENSSRSTKTGFKILGIFGLGLGLYFRNKFKESNLLEGEVENIFYSSRPFDLNSFIRLLPIEKQEYENPFNKMQKEVYEQVFLGKQCRVTGYFDHSKEIKVPYKNEHDGKPGYLIFSPFYYVDYENKPHESEQINNFLKNETSDKIYTKGSIIVNRGW